MVLDILLVFLGICFLLCGLVGCVLPVIPGPPLSYVALWLLQATRFGNFSLKFLIITAVITLVVTIIDYTLPAWATKRWGGSRAGVIGSILGLLLGLFFLPFGIVIGPFAGAVVGELIAGRDTKSAFRSGVGSFMGFLFGTAMKLTLSFVFLFYFIKEWIF
ncbi:MAG: DUF456 domain-containing protein [Prevotellaceae bacterium]|jgi:uncharacterized protein YqgC (DUF456 family)|nr:DUF456 domain-containing protein [Prevotellaceae bacterium]